MTAVFTAVRVPEFVIYHPEQAVPRYARRLSLGLFLFNFPCLSFGIMTCWWIFSLFWIKDLNCLHTFTHLGRQEVGRRSNLRNFWYNLCVVICIFSSFSSQRKECRGNCGPQFSAIFHNFCNFWGSSNHNSPPEECPVRFDAGCEWIYLGLFPPPPILSSAGV